MIGFLVDEFGRGKGPAAPERGLGQCPSEDGGEAACACEDQLDVAGVGVAAEDSRIEMRQVGSGNS